MSLQKKEPYPMIFRYLIALGTNLGDRGQNCQRACELLSPQVSLVRKSRMIETFPLKSEAYDISDHGTYGNQIVEIQTDLRPDLLYGLLAQIEDSLGHDRQRRWAPRHMDLDILFWADHREGLPFGHCPQKVWQEEGESLQIPHYDVQNRDFLWELLADWNLMKGLFPVSAPGFSPHFPQKSAHSYQ